MCQRRHIYPGEKKKCRDGAEIGDSTSRHAKNRMSVQRGNELSSADLILANRIIIPVSWDGTV